MQHDNGCMAKHVFEFMYLQCLQVVGLYIHNECVCGHRYYATDKLYIILDVSLGPLGSDPTEFSRDPRNKSTIL